MDKKLIRELKAWEAENYDGIKGALPTWVPNVFRRSFYLHRYTVFIKVVNGECTYERVQELLRIYENTRERIEYEMGHDNSCDSVDEALTKLANLYRAVKVGEIEGLRMLNAPGLSSNSSET